MGNFFIFLILIVIVKIIHSFIRRNKPPTEEEILERLINGLSASIDRMKCKETTKKEIYSLLSTGIFNEQGQYLGMFPNNPWIKERCDLILLVFGLHSGNYPKMSIGEIIDHFEGQYLKDKCKHFLLIYTK